MSIKNILLSTAISYGIASSFAVADEITIATVNNADMITMQELAPAWEKATGNTINWVVLEENVLRQRVQRRTLQQMVGHLILCSLVHTKLQFGAQMDG